MSVRAGVVLVSIVTVGVLAASCAATPTPSEPSASPNRTAQPAEPESASKPGVSWLRVAPQEGLRNARVSIDVACLDNLGTVHSPVLDIGALQPDPAGHQPWHRTGTATVHSDAAPGQYSVSVTCGAEMLSAAFTVVPHP